MTYSKTTDTQQDNQNSETYELIMSLKLNHLQDKILSEITKMLHDLITQIKALQTKQTQQINEAMLQVKQKAQNLIRNHLKVTMSNITQQVKKLRSQTKEILDCQVKKRINDEILQLQQQRDQEASTNAYDLQLAKKQMQEQLNEIKIYMMREKQVIQTLANTNKRLLFDSKNIFEKILKYRSKIQPKARQILEKNQLLRSEQKSEK